MWKNIDKIKKIISESKNKTEVLDKMNLKNNGGNYNTLSHFIMSHGVCIEHFGRKKPNRKVAINQSQYKNILDFLVVDSGFKSTNHLKNRLYKEGLKSRECEICGQNEFWRGAKMSLILDHINGNRHDNRLENLRIVCPNCNATLETHCRGHNIKKKEKYNICVCGNKKVIDSVTCKDCYRHKYKKEKYDKIYDTCTCGGMKRLNSNRCKNCNKINKKSFLETIKNRRVTDRPPLDVLLIEISELGYLQTGRKYGVSDNTIRKWKKMYEKYGKNF